MSEDGAMSPYTLTKTRFSEGTWEGVVTADGRGTPRPEVVATHLGTSLTGVTVTDTAEPGRWVLKVPVPPQAVGDGVQTVLIADARTDATLGSVTLVAGEPLHGDLQAEIDLLRAELDMLKRAFRRHCAETA